MHLGLSFCKFLYEVETHSWTYFQVQNTTVKKKIMYAREDQLMNIKVSKDHPNSDDNWYTLDLATI
jgi:hypothetical protein